jgi:site-specific DNA recombinase
MLRAAIYARYSSDSQNDKSVEDQIELCPRALTVVAISDDRAISGASVINRPGYQNLMRAAETKSIDVLVAEDKDRVFRDQSDYHHARKQLDQHGISIHTAVGKVSKLEGSLRAQKNGRPSYFRILSGISNPHSILMSMPNCP